MTDESLNQAGRAPGWRAALSGLCPTCSAPTLFEGPVQFAERCKACGQDFSGQNVGDGPAAFLTMIIGALVIALAMLAEIYIHPPFWVHLLIWVPFTVAAVIFGLRAAKGWLFHAEWFRRAREGRIAEDGDAS
jgi:uncharacterized protein (DUF983 family)